MMRLSRIAAILLRQYYLVRGSPPRLLPIFVWAGVDIVLWGFLSRYLSSVAAGQNFVPALLGAVLLWDFFIRVMADDVDAHEGNEFHLRVVGQDFSQGLGAVRLRGNGEQHFFQIKAKHTFSPSGKIQAKHPLPKGARNAFLSCNLLTGRQGPGYCWSWSR